MTKKFTLTPSKTYKTEENATKAVQDLFDNTPQLYIRFIVVENKEGRFYPICIGTDAVQAGTHFHFVTIA